MRYWIAIAKKEIWQKTTFMRKNRGLYFVIVYSLLFFWALYLGPSILNTILPDAFASYSDILGPLIVSMAEYFLTMLFLTYFMYPCYNLFRKSEIGYKERILASPATPGDIFLGEFLGQVPFYFMGVLFVGPMIISGLQQVVELGIIEYIIIYITLFTLMVLGFLIGTIIANWLEHRMSQSQKAVDKGKSLLIIMSSIVIFIFYIFHFVFGYLVYHPEVKNFFMFMPSFWYSNILIYLINPTLLDVSILNIWASISLAISIPLLIFYISYKKADFFFVLEKPIETISRASEEEGGFYKLMRKITPSRWEELVVTQYKDFFRKRENVTKIVFSFALTAVLCIIVRISMEDPELLPFQSSLNTPIIIAIITWMGGMTFGILMGVYIFISSKDLLYQYRKTKRGVNALIYSYLIQLFYIILFFDIVLTVLMAIVFQLDFLLAIFFFVMYLVNCEIVILEIVGMQCLNPLFEERGKDVYMNIYSVFALQMFSLFLTIVIFVPNAPAAISGSVGFLIILLINLGISSSFGISVFFLGKRSLKNIE